MAAMCPAVRAASLALIFALAPLTVSAVPAAAAAGDAASPSVGQQVARPELVALVKEFRAWRRGSEAVPKYVERFRDRERRLPEFQSRLRAIDPSSWTVSERVDYLIALVEMNAMQFDLAVLRPEFRNPDYYALEAADRVTRHLGTRYQVGPVPAVPYDAAHADRIIAALDDTSAVIDQAIPALTEAVPELAQVAIERLEKVDAYYRDLGRVVGEHVPASHRERLTAAAAKAGDALARYRTSLMEKKPSMTGAFAIGLPAFEWHVRNVLVMPYDAKELLMQADMERSRNWAYFQLEQQKNRNLPGYDGPKFGAWQRPLPVTPVKTFEEYSELKDATDVLSRLWAKEHDLFTPPADLGPMRVREGGVHIGDDRDLIGLLGFPKTPIPAGEKVEFMVDYDHFFSGEYQEFAKWMDPGVNHPHSDYPGHTFENWLSPGRASRNEIRKGHNTRGDAWTFYMEDLQLQLDYPFVRGPRVREWMYAIALWRVERIEIAVRLASGEMTPEQAVAYLNDAVPWMTTFKSKRMEVWGMLAEPTTMLKYQPTKFQLLKVLAARFRQLGPAFNLREFHDQLLGTGRVPLALTLWEMAGDDRDAAHLWKREPLPRKAQVR